MKAARMHEYGKALVLDDVPVPDIKPDEVLVQVRACGMCRSDVQLIDGYFRNGSSCQSFSMTAAAAFRITSSTNLG